ncbi:MAG: hypothetical protein V1746_00495 [bacterium]
MDDFKDKLMVAVPLGTALLLLTIVMSVLLWTQSAKLREVSNQLKTAQKNFSSQTEEQTTLLSSKEESLQALSEEIKKQTQEVEILKEKLASSQEASQEKGQSLENNFVEQKQLNEDALDRVKAIDTSLKVLRTRCSRLEDDVHQLKGQTADQDRQTGALRDRFTLLQRALGISLTEQQQGAAEERIEPTKINPKPRYPSNYPSNPY